jgi:uncharacterized protein YkwD
MARNRNGFGAKALVVSLFAALVLLASAGQAAAETVTARNAAEPTLVERINDVRAAHGLNRLRASSLLRSAATRHGNSMGSRGYFRHELHKKSRWVTFSTWIHWYWPGPEYTVWTAGENLAWGAPDLSTRDTVRMWMNSPGHRANILGAWRRIGVAIVHVTAPAGYYGDYPEVTIVAAEFGRRSG